MDDHEQVAQQEAALQAVGDLVGQLYPGAMVQRFVVIAEIIDADAERAVWCTTAPDQRAWDTLGLLDFARLIEHAAYRAE